MNVRRLVKAALFTLTLTGSGLFAVHSSPAEAGTHVNCSDASSWGVRGTSSSPAGLVISTLYQGNLVNGSVATVRNIDGGSTSIGDVNLNNRTNSKSFNVGEQCGGRVIMGNGGRSYGNGGDGWVLDCKQYLGRYTNYTAHFAVGLSDLPGHRGHWQFDTGYGFSVVNGGTTWVRADWIDDPPPMAVIQGYKVDLTGNPNGGYSDAMTGIAYVGNNRNNPFGYTVNPGTHTLDAETPRNGWKVDHIDVFCNGNWCGQTYSAHAVINAIAGWTYDTRIYYTQDDNAACANPLPNQTVVAGDTFQFNASMFNSGTSTWSGMWGYHMVAYFENNSTVNGVPPGTTRFGSPGSPLNVFLNSNPLYIGAYTNASFMTGQFSTMNTDGTMMQAGDYYVNYLMSRDYGGDGGGNHFGQVCSFRVTVKPNYSYVPDVVGSPSGQAGIPGAVIANTGGATTVNVTGRVKNTCTSGLPTCSPVGAPANIQICSYTARYSTAGGATSISLPTCTSNPVSGGIGAGQIATIGTSVSIPSTVPDGTQYCFYSGVSPAANMGASQVASRYSNANSVNFNQYDNLGNNNTNDMCYDVQNYRSLALSVTQGDVHAGGGVLGSTCDLTSTQGSITSGKGSVAEYVVSAGGSINGLGSGGAASSNAAPSTYNKLTFGNNGGSFGNYGQICRPDMAAAARNYPTVGTLGGDVDLSTLARGLYKATGTVTIHGQVSNRVTIFADGFDIRVTGNISYGTSSSVATAPSLGIITGNGGNILVSKVVTQMAGFYIAQGRSDGSGGTINTCSEHSGSSTGDCPNTLNVLGSLVGSHITFARTGNLPAGQGSTQTTESITQSGLLYLAPPPVFETQPNTSYGMPQYGGEGLPLY